MHWIWFPSFVPDDPPRVSLFLTWGDGYYLADGSDVFVRQVLAEVGVHEPVRAWTLQRHRACYFAPDPETSSADDLWPFAWKLIAELAEPPSSLDRLPEGRKETEAEDDTWSSTNNPMHATSSRCLVVGDFEDRASLHAARARIAELLPGASFADGLAFACFPQLHVDLGERDHAWLAAGAPDARIVQDVIVEHGASLFYADSIARALAP